jgi:uncharacterized protein (DUF433 family)
MKEDPRPYQERIIADPRILAGKPVVRGTRIAVDLVLEELAQNPDIDELLAAHPDLTRTDVQACLAYAKAMVTGEEVSPKPPKGARSNATPVGGSFSTRAPISGSSLTFAALAMTFRPSLATTGSLPSPEARSGFC